MASETSEESAASILSGLKVSSNSEHPQMGATEPPISLQQGFWNAWNASNREKQLDKVSIEQAEVVVAWLERMGRPGLEIIDVGCGAGWFCSHLARFGHVTGTDLSDEVLGRAAARLPEAKFVAGDFMKLDFPREAFDVAVSFEMLSHVADQQALLRKICDLLRPKGYFMIATQNRPVLQRNAVPPPKPGQLRHWVDRHELRDLLQKDFEIEELFSITPQFNRGLMKIPNSSKLNRLATTIGLGPVMRRVKKLQERAWLGWTLMALARKRH